MKFKIIVLGVQSIWIVAQVFFVFTDFPDYIVSVFDGVELNFSSILKSAWGALACFMLKNFIYSLKEQVSEGVF